MSGAISRAFILDIKEQALGGSCGVLNCHLDSPRKSHQLGDCLIVSGWLLKKSNEDDIYITVEFGKESANVPLDIPRGDVLSSVLRINPASVASHAQFNSGFQYELRLSSDDNVNIYVCRGGERYLWVTISPTYVDQDDLFTGVWDFLTESNADCKSIERCTQGIKKFGPDAVARILMEGVQVLGAGSFLSPSGSHQSHNIRRLLNGLIGDDFPLLAVQQASEKGVITVPDPFSSGYATCNSSFSAKNNINVLFFSAENKETFLIFQHVSSADAIYFPGLKKLVIFDHLSLEHVRVSLTSMLEEYSQIACYSNSSARKFLGVICSNGRPYHFYYDVAPAVNFLFKAGVLDKVSKIFYYKGGNFCSFKDIYNLKCTEESLAPSSLARLTLRDEGFCFHVATLFKPTRAKQAIDFDKTLIRYSRENYGYKNDSSLKDIYKCYPVIWVGITVQKRSWLEQVEAIANILNKLSEEYPQLAVIFDGWTSPLDITEGDLKETNNDIEVCNKIIKLLKPSIKSFSVVGANSYKKIVYARNVDVYTGNSATGGLHIDRFCSRPGVAHLSTRLIDSDEHIRNRTVLVDKLHIHDRPEDANMRKDFVSYSLDWRIVYDGVCSILNGESV